MLQKSDTRLARVAKARTPSELPAARHRSLLRAHAALGGLLRERSAMPDTGWALAGVMQLGDAAAAALADIPDTPELRKTDAALLAHDHAGAEETFEARLSRLVRQCADGRELAPANASPAELLAACVAKATGSG